MKWWFQRSRPVQPIAVAEIRPTALAVGQPFSIATDQSSRFTHEGFSIVQVHRGKSCRGVAVWRCCARYMGLEKQSVDEMWLERAVVGTSVNTAEVWAQPHPALSVCSRAKV